MSEIIGQKLKRIREEKGFSLIQVMEATGISENYLNYLEDGQLKNQSASVLYKLSEMYQIELKPLLLEAGIIVKKERDNY